MENKLKRLFDYQRFEQNPTLGRLIEAAELSYGAELSDAALEQVAAAGEVSAAPTAPDIISELRS